MLRPFAAVVCPGADAKRLGGGELALHPLLPDAALAPLGLPDSARRRVTEALQFAQLLRLPRLTLLRRRHDGAEPLGASPAVERLRRALHRRGETLRAWVDPRVDRARAVAPLHPTAPGAPSLLPVQLSATACEALRACPYRFYTLYALHGREADELDDDLGPRDYGNWLHAVLHAFHLDRGGTASAEDDTRNLHRHALALRDAHALDAADFVPFAASFAAFVPHYVAWLQARDRAGARWQVGEQPFRMTLPDAIGIDLEGIIDRIDDAPGGALDLIDYKTGSASKLAEKVRTPLEDTQLAFYAALMRAHSSAPLRAVYLALDTSAGIEAIEHPQVERSAARLVAGLTLDLRRLRAGAGMAPLGEAEACEYCAARGVCRRDHWSDGTMAPAADVEAPQGESPGGDDAPPAADEPAAPSAAVLREQLTLFDSAP